MKRFFAIALALAVLAGLLGACSSGGPSMEFTAAPTTAEPTTRRNPAFLAPRPEQLQPQVFTQEGFDVRKEYFSVAGMADEAVQEKLNQALYAFFVGDMLFDKRYSYRSQAQGVLIGHYLSAVSTSGHGAAGEEPTEYRKGALVFDLETGEVAPQLIHTGAPLMEALRAGRFAQTWPEEPVPGALEELIDSLPAAWESYGVLYYLTDFGVTLLLRTNNASIEFAAPYSDLDGVLTPALQAALPN